MTASPEAAIRRVALAIVPAARPTPRARALSNDSASILFFEALFFELRILDF